MSSNKARGKRPAASTKRERRPQRRYERPANTLKLRVRPSLPISSQLKSVEESGWPLIWGLKILPIFARLPSLGLSFLLRNPSYLQELVAAWPIHLVEQDWNSTGHIYCLHRPRNSLGIGGERHETTTIVSKEEYYSVVSVHAGDFIECHKNNKTNIAISFPVPEIGPLTNKGEGQLELYNRCWELVKYLRSGFYRSNWKTRFATLHAVENGTVVSEAHASSWMQSSAQKVVSGLSSIKKAFASDKLALINVEVKLVRGIHIASNMETEAAIQKALDREVELPPSEFRLLWDS
ncbi:hypothetical protein N7537_004574 [Penicillium hordei]|uniref:Uncharacterized protein n=1 Tax=Penicillium hordei TaxID=40994 RepID=A0AAD6EBI3_9EURO|nr:uncharacterized protein N7537_004574 [Penicillium hordei]KAJ5607955.1 hypothetical protein N7537_004574 [Penicillium hordei]